MRIRKEHIYLTDRELSQTRDLVATELSCGHNVVPKIKRSRYMQRVRCEMCGHNVNVLSDTVYTDASTVLKEQR